MFRTLRFIPVLALALSVQSAAAQESAAAKATREKLKQVIDIDEKEIGAKVFFDTVSGEMEKPVKFKIDNVSGVSNNSKGTYKAKLRNWLWRPS